jgi:hypothetical protein
LTLYQQSRKASLFDALGVVAKAFQVIVVFRAHLRDLLDQRPAVRGGERGLVSAFVAANLGEFNRAGQGDRGGPVPAEFPRRRGRIAAHGRDS